MAAKKVKLEAKPINEKELPPAVDEAVVRFELDSLIRAANGRGVGKRLRMDGQSELIVIDAGASSLSDLPYPPKLYTRPDISADGTHAIAFVPDVGMGPGVIEFSLDKKSHTRIWEGGAGFNVRSQPLTRALYAGDEHILLATTGKQALAKRTGKSSEAVAFLDGLENTWTCDPVIGGRFFVFNATSQTFLVAAKGDALHVVKKAAKKKDPFVVRGGRLFVQDVAAKKWGEVDNLEAIWSSL